MKLPRAWNALLLVASLIFLVATARAQEVHRVVDIVVEGNKVSSKTLILGSSTIVVGSPFTPNIVSETIKRLYSLRIFSDVEIEAESVSGGVKVYITVKELPKLTALEFSGSDKISAKSLKEKLGLGVGGYISPYLVYQKGREIEKLYAEKGYFQIRVEPKLTYSADSSEAALNYHIDAKSKIKVEEVIITGTNRVNPSDLVGKMRNRSRGILRTSDFAQEKYEEDKEKVANELHKRGFIDAYLISDSLSIDTVNNKMKIYLHIYEGPCYYFGTTTFAGNEKLPKEFLAKKLKHREGDIFNEEKYDESLTEMYTSYHDIGHLHVRVADERATRADSVLDIKYDFTEGLPSKIRYIAIVGNNKTKEKVIRREMPIFPGQTFNRALVIQTVRDLMALNYFSNVLPAPIDLPNGDIDLEIKVEEKQTGSVSAGAGYNSQDKVVGNVGMTIPNFRGMGQNVAFNVEFGKNRNSFSLSFTEPWFMGRPTSVGADAYLTNRNWYDDYTEAKQGGSLRIGRRLNAIDRYLRGFASYRLERDKYYDFSDAFIETSSTKVYRVRPDTTTNANDSDYVIMSTIPREPYEGSIIEFDNVWRTLSNVSFTLVRDSRNLPEFATKGSRVSYTYEIVGGPLGGYFNYQKHSVTAAKFFPVLGDIALGIKMQYGAITRPKGDERVLLSERFTPGGTAFDGIVRGYEDADLTPRSYESFTDTLMFYTNSEDSTVDSTKVIERTSQQQQRGNYMFVTNIELQFPIMRQQLYAIAFLDGGNAWLRHRDIDIIDDFYWGTGVGFRLVIPGIGTLGFDFGYPLENYRGNGQSIKPHFQIGTTFR
jgi:outer membrane protein insertion porin family